MSDVTLETIYRVYDETHEGHFLEVGPSGDFPEMLELRTTGASAEWFGSLSVNMSKDFAHLLGQALLKAAP